MNSEAEMRQVLLHAAERLEKGSEITMNCGHYNYICSHRLPKGPLIAMSYSEGVLKLLASYLKVEPEKRSPATLEPGWTPAKPNGHQSNSPRVSEETGGRNDAAAPAAYRPPGEKTERNAAVVAAVEGGASRKDVAVTFGISERRVGQIMDAAAAKEAGP